jgi:RNA polymerase sigma factor (TIGR02999 family)
MPQVYDDLRRLARAFLARERQAGTLQPTALVHEAWLRLAGQSRVAWQGRTHFFAVGAKVMRRLLVDHARRHRRQRRGGDWQRVTLGAVDFGAPAAGLSLHDLLALNDALTRLAEIDAREAQVVELRFFAGLELEQIAELLGVSRRTVAGDWSHARAWLAAQLEAAPRA